jgi:hypothetical protein
MSIQQISDREVVTEFVAHLNARGHPGLRFDRIPEDEGGSDPPIDAVAGHFAIEHTSVDTVENQRRDASWFMRGAGDLESELRGKVSYRLNITLPYEGIEKGQGWSQIKSSLKSWILNQSALLIDGPHQIEGVSGIPFDFRVIKASDRPPGIFFARSFPSENSLPQRIEDLFKRKARKLKAFRSAGFTTILLAESDDIALMNQFLLVDAIRTAFSGALPKGVDEIWYADTAIPLELEFHDITAEVCRR